MARHTLYAYIEGDFHGAMDAEFAGLINSTQWRYSEPRLIVQGELGLNIDLPDPPNEPEGWFGDIERIVQFLSDLHSTTGNTFVIGISDNEGGYSEDLFWIDSGSPDFVKLRQIVGVRD